MSNDNNKVKAIISELEALRGSEEKRRVLASFFKTGKGQYGEGDVMLGVTVPNTRQIAKKHADLSLQTVEELLHCNYHEVRLCALLILVEQYKVLNRKKDSAAQERREIVELYLRNAPYINNWDLVDLSAPQIVGQYLLDKTDRQLLYNLAADSLLWRRRIAVVSTYTLIRHGSYQDTLNLVRLLISDSQDLMHKAMGWMLREVGKQEEVVLTDFLDETAHILPRTTLRYAIERLAPERRKYYMEKKKYADIGKSV